MDEWMGSSMENEEEEVDSCMCDLSVVCMMGGLPPSHPCNVISGGRDYLDDEDADTEWEDRDCCFTSAPNTYPQVRYSRVKGHEEEDDDAEVVEGVRVVKKRGCLRRKVGRMSAMMGECMRRGSEWCGWMWR